VTAAAAAAAAPATVFPTRAAISTPSEEAEGRYPYENPLAVQLRTAARPTTQTLQARWHCVRACLCCAVCVDAQGVSIRAAFHWYYCLSPA
jgi:hypothetical protein